MRKIIVGLMIIAIGVLCLSFTSRISDGIFNTFFDDESSDSSGSGSNDSGSSGGNGSASGDNSNTGDNVSTGGSSGNGSGSDSGNNSGDSSGGNGSTSGDSSDTGNNDSTGGGSEDGGSSSGGESSGSEVIFVNYSRGGSTFDKNYIVDTANGEKDGNYYYYPVQGTSYYAKSDVSLDGTKRYIVDMKSYFYVKENVWPVEETNDYTKFFSIGNFNSIEASSEFYFYHIEKAKEEFSMDMADCVQIGNYYFAATLYGDYYVFIKSDNPFSPLTYGYTVYNNSPLFGLTYTYVSETEELSNIEQGGLRA